MTSEIFTPIPVRVIRETIILAQTKRGTTFISDLPTVSMPAISLNSLFFISDTLNVEKV